MISRQTIDEAVRRLAEAAKPPKVILFGAYARGHSDLDFLVVEREVTSRRKEMARLDGTPRIAVESTQLPGQFHRDPGDRIPVATATVHQCPLLTADGRY